jgi:hypothetical protein
MRKRKRLLLIAVALAAISGSAAALAAAPELTRFSFQDEFVDTETCPTIPIATRVEGHVSIHEFSDTLVQVHQRLIFTASANGKTYTDNESYTERIDPGTGIRRFTGTTVSIQIPHYGRLLADTRGRAGRAATLRDRGP